MNFGCRELNRVMTAPGIPLARPYSDPVVDPHPNSTKIQKSTKPIQNPMVNKYQQIQSKCNGDVGIEPATASCGSKFCHQYIAIIILH